MLPPRVRVPTEDRGERELGGGGEMATCKIQDMGDGPQRPARGLFFSPSFRATFPVIGLS